jgi:hypothetical protein
VLVGAHSKLLLLLTSPAVCGAGKAPAGAGAGGRDVSHKRVALPPSRVGVAIRDRSSYHLLLHHVLVSLLTADFPRCRRMMEKTHLETFFSDEAFKDPKIVISQPEGTCVYQMMTFALKFLP